MNYKTSRGFSQGLTKMSKKAFDQIMEGLNEALAFTRGELDVENLYMEGAATMSIKDSTVLEITVTDGGDKEISFTVHQEPSRAQKEVDDDNPPGPWPWWVDFDDDKHIEWGIGGPYQDRIIALVTAFNYVLNRC